VLAQHALSSRMKAPSRTVDGRSESDAMRNAHLVSLSLLACFRRALLITLSWWAADDCHRWRHQAVSRLPSHGSPHSAHDGRLDAAAEYQVPLRLNA
jgi:hypothetical protein